MRQRAAIFDLDGTLISSASAERTFFFHLLRNGGLSPIDLLRMIIPLWTFRGNVHSMLLGSKRYLRNKSVQKFSEVAQLYFEREVERLVFPLMREKIEEHRRNDEVLLLLSGTLDVIAECFVRELRLDGARATNLEVRDGKYTGRVRGVVPYGFGKLEVLRDFRHEYNFDQNQTTVYANIYSDRYLMNAVETPVAVNPDTRLREYALRNSWRILDPAEHPQRR